MNANDFEGLRMANKKASADLERLAKAAAKEKDFGAALRLMRLTLVALKIEQGEL